ncbi:hypothetical protein Cgig2_000365 [Carnegiea gigantea]|uniref:Uncharacterized protein n=1 Tax=Carnegiea gigantea TaxID=171969 RepID=A0A9Q1K3F3_9CARY|nr:hypothetical protein Cgig2_000365 [Carnegiea gigantea]
MSCPKLQEGYVSSISIKALPQTTLIMEKIKEKDISIFHLLRDNEPLEQWARFKFYQTLKLDDNTNNFVKSLNNRYVNLYDGIVHPIPDSCFWGECTLPTLDPPFELRKRGMPEKHKRKKSKLSIPQQMSSIHLNGTERGKKGKQIGHNNLICWKPRDKMKKPRQKTNNLVSRPKKIQKVSQASISVATVSRVPTQSSQAI